MKSNRNGELNKLVQQLAPGPYRCVGVGGLEYGGLGLESQDENCHLYKSILMDSDEIQNVNWA